MSGLATLIQKSWRGHRVRVLRRRMLWACMKMQSLYRGRMARRQLQFLQRAALVICKILRGYVGRKTFLDLKESVVYIQRTFRRKLAVQDRIRLSTISTSGFSEFAPLEPVTPMDLDEFETLVQVEVTDLRQFHVIGHSSLIFMSTGWCRLWDRGLTRR